MSKGVFLCVGTGGHVLPAYNVIKSMLNKGLDKKNILVVTDERGVEYFKDKDIEIIVYPFVSSQKGIGAYLLKLIKMLSKLKLFRLKCTNLVLFFNSILLDSKVLGD